MPLPSSLYTFSLYTRRHLATAGSLEEEEKEEEEWRPDSRTSPSSALAQGALRPCLAAYMRWKMPAFLHPWPTARTVHAARPAKRSAVMSGLPFDLALRNHAGSHCSPTKRVICACRGCCSAGQVGGGGRLWGLSGLRCSSRVPLPLQASDQLEETGQMEVRPAGGCGWLRNSTVAEICNTSTSCAQATVNKTVVVKHR